MAASPHGTHLLLEMTGATGLDDPARIEAALAAAARACGATILAVHVHRFAPQGVTGVALLAESHLTVHTWPETGYAAFDLFLCNHRDPAPAIPVLRAAFEAKHLATRLIERGPVALA